MGEGKRLVVLAVFPLCIVTGCQPQEEPATEDSTVGLEQATELSTDSSVGVYVIPVEITGVGHDRDAAIQDAVVRAIEEVHGPAVAAVHGIGLEQQPELQVQALSGATAGYVTSVRVLDEIEPAVPPSTSNRNRRGRALSLDDSPSLVWSVRVEVGVAGYAPRDSPPIALVVSVENGEADPQWAELLEQEASAVLYRTDRVSVLDREGSATIRRELELALGGRSTPRDAVRLGQVRVADLAVLGTIEEFQIEITEQPMRTTDRSVRQARGSARASFRLVDVATLEVLGIGSTSASRETEPTLSQPNTTGWEGAMATELAEGVGRQVANLLFPVRVIDREGQEVTLNAGEGRIENGSYAVFALGSDLVDPATGRILGRRERNCCTLDVYRVAEQLAFGRLDQDPELAAGEVLEVRVLSGRSPSR